MRTRASKGLRVPAGLTLQQIGVLKDASAELNDADLALTMLKAQAKRGDWNWAIKNAVAVLQNIQNASNYASRADVPSIATALGLAQRKILPVVRKLLAALKKADQMNDTQRARLIRAIDTTVRDLHRMLDAITIYPIGGD